MVRTTRSGVKVALVDNRTGEFEDQDRELRWFTVCLAHQDCVGHGTKRPALEWLSHPEDWCSGCQESERRTRKEG